MRRREYLITSGGALAVLVAGCVATNGDSSAGDNAGGGETPSLPPPTLESHDVQEMVQGYKVVVTMTNETESVLNRAVGEVSVYDGNTRLADGRAAVIDLEPATTASESALLADLSPEDVTHYTITMSGETEEYEDTATKEFEFNGDEFRSRLDE